MILTTYNYYYGAILLVSARESTVIIALFGLVELSISYYVKNLSACRFRLIADSDFCILYVHGRIARTSHCP